MPTSSPRVGRVFSKEGNDYIIIDVNGQESASDMDIEEPDEEEDDNRKYAETTKTGVPTFRDSNGRARRVDNGRFVSERNVTTKYVDELSQKWQERAGVDFIVY